MKGVLRALAVALLAAGCAASPPPPVAAPGTAVPYADSVLQRALEEATAGFGGEVGVFARHLGTGATAALRADELFPTASMIKVPLLVKLADEVEAGRIGWDEQWLFADSLRYADDDLSAKLRDGERMPVSELAWLMVALSDNTASLWIQARVGGGAAVNEWLAANGFEGTRVNSRTPGRRPDWERYGWGQTTPREMAELLVRIRQGRAVSPAASARMYRLLGKSYWDEEALSALPPGVWAASKQGFVDRSRSEVLLVHSPGGEYVLAVITRNQRDTTYVPENEGSRLLRRVSGVVYGHWSR